MKDSCEEGYGKHCFKCDSKNRMFALVSCGAGMDTEMLEDFGRRQIAISCSCYDGYLVLLLNKEGIKELSNGKVNNLDKISVEEFKHSITRKDIQDYLDNNGEGISTKVYQPCRILPDYP